MKSVVRNTVLISLLFLIAGLAVKTASSHEKNYTLHSRGTATISEASPLTEEMTTLDSAFREIVSAVALDDSDNVRKAIASMRGTKERTHEGIHAGTVILPKNAARVKDFIERDRNFHDKLEALDRAARHNNLREMQRITHQLLNACIQCHQVYRQ
jgi:cytochrome c556